MENDQRLTGFVTLPSEAGCEAAMLELAHKWGADAIRDSDGTQLSPEILQLGFPIYSTLCLVRADQEWAYARRDQLAQKYLMSAPVTAASAEVEIELLKGYFKEKYAVDFAHDPKLWWEVIDRTTGEVMDAAQWEYSPKTEHVTIRHARLFHVFTVSFLVSLTWDSTSMYNHLVNHWTKPHVMGVDPYRTETYQHLLTYFERWLEAHSDTDVVRLTTLAYHFTLDSDESGRDKYRDWLGYTDTVSIEALEDFAREYGYRLRPEDFVDQGYYNATYRLPSKPYLDWMDFIHKFVVRYGKDLVERTHRAGKRAAIFWGDHWIGVEPYRASFQEMGVDIHVGACEDGVSLRRVADAPGSQLKEIRLYPYFFPDVFRPDGNPAAESMRNWVKIRRALLRAPVDRIGHGGYLSVVPGFPDFIEHVANLCDEFRRFKAHSGSTKPYRAPIKVAILDAWGAPRSWINHASPDQKFYVTRPDTFEIVGSNMLECLAGLPVDVQFLSFQEIEANGIPDDIHVIINEGSAGTAWSGGRYWKDESIVTALRAWVHRGGGFIGIGDPSAYEYQGRFFQLADVMGVQKETGSTINAATCQAQPAPNHFIREDQPAQLELGVEKSYVYSIDRNTEVFAEDNSHILGAAHRFGSGRSVYLAGLVYSPENSRLLGRAIFWASRAENRLKRWFCSNSNVDCAAFPETGYFALANISGIEQRTTLYFPDGRESVFELPPYACQWFLMDEGSQDDR